MGAESLMRQMVLCQAMYIIKLTVERKILHGHDVFAFNLRLQRTPVCGAMS